MSKPSNRSLLEYDSIPEREYYVAPRRKRRKSIAPLMFLMMGVLLFCGGFLLGKASAASSDLLPDTEIVISLPQMEHDDEKMQEETGESIGDISEDAAEAEWNLILINGEHPLPEDFQIPELTQLRNGQAIDSRVYQALQEMMDAARAEGLQPLICSSFRTWDKQEKLFSNKVQSYLAQGYSQVEAEEKVAYWVARPGTSEHQAGLAVDIVDTNYQSLDEQQEETPVQLWLMEHCAEYGFILRYPRGKSDLTGVGYEPWHYRYVGEEAAREIMDQGVCLEEYAPNA